MQLQQPGTGRCLYYEMVGLNLSLRSKVVLVGTFRMCTYEHSEIMTTTYLRSQCDLYPNFNSLYNLAIISDIALYIFVYYHIYVDDVHNAFDARIFRGMYIFPVPTLLLFYIPVP